MALARGLRGGAVRRGCAAGPACAAPRAAFSIPVIPRPASGSGSRPPRSWPGSTATSAPGSAAAPPHGDTTPPSAPTPTNAPATWKTSRTPTVADRGELSDAGVTGTAGEDERGSGPGGEVPGWSDGRGSSRVTACLCLVGKSPVEARQRDTTRCQSPKGIATLAGAEETRKSLPGVRAALRRPAAMGEGRMTGLGGGRFAVES